MMESNLPLGWVKSKIGDYFEQVKDKMEPDQSASMPYIGLEHLAKGGGVESIGKSDDLRSTKSVFQSGDVLYGKLRPYLNKHAFMPFEGVCSTDILIFRSNHPESAKLLNYFLGLPAVINYANENAQGINLPRVSGTTMQELEFPLPPLAEQHRIVARLDALMEKVESARERLEKIPAILKRFRQAVLAAAVSGRLTADWREKNPDVESAEELVNLISQTYLSKGQLKFISSTDSALNFFSLPPKWLCTKLTSIAEVVDPNPSHRMPEYVKEGVPFISTENFIGNDVINFVKGKKVTAKTLEEQIQRFKISKGTFALTRIGTIGRTCKLPVERNYCLSHAVCLITAYKGVSPEYLRLVVSSDTVLNQAHEGVQSVGVPDLGMGKIRSFIIPFPPPEEQHEIVRRVEELFKLADNIEARYQTAKAYLDQLPQAILAKAFRGELVPQDPSDEPASMLLERIQAEKASAGKKGKKTTSHQLTLENI